MKRFLPTLLFFLLCQFVSATIIDSSAYRALMNEGRAQFCTLFDHNAEAIAKRRTNELQFVIELSGNENVSYVQDVATGSNYGPTYSAPSVKDSLNARLQRVYAQYGVEMYIVLISSLDVIITSDLPDTISTQRLFIQKLYDEQTNLAQLRATHAALTNDIIAYATAGHQRDCIIFSEAQYCGVFRAGAKKGCWAFTKISHYNAPTATYPSIAGLQDYFYRRLSSSWNALAGNIDQQLYTTVDEFKESTAYFALKNAILHTYSPDTLNDIFRQFDEDIDFRELTVEERVHCLSVYSGYPMAGSWLLTGIGEEGRAIRIINYTPKEQADELLQALAQPSVLNDNPNYHGDKDQRALIRRLVERTDDAAMSSDNNYTQLVQVLSRLVTTSEQTFNAHLPTNDEGWHDRQITWNDPQTLPAIGTMDYDIALNDNGNVTVTRKIVDHWTRTAYNAQSGEYSHSPSWSTDASFDLSPFDLVFFTNRSTVGMLQVAGAQHGQLFVAPAIFLKYADDKSFNRSALAASAQAVDVLTIFTGPLVIGDALAAGDLALSAFEATQFLGSAGNLAANAISDPDLQSVVDKYNLIVSVWGLSKIVTNGARFTVSFFTEARAGELKAVAPSQAEDFIESYKQAEGKLGQLDNATKEQVEKMEEYLEGKVGAVEGVVAASSVSFEEFANTVADFKNGANSEIAHQAYELWKEQKWGELEQLFTSHNLNGGWPPFDGFIYKQPKMLQIGDEFDRYGGRWENNIFTDDGKFVAPTDVPFEQRALQESVLSRPKMKYKVLVAFTVEAGPSIPWFNQPGKGTQYFLPETINQLVANHYIERLPQ